MILNISTFNSDDDVSFVLFSIKSQFIWIKALQKLGFHYSVESIVRGCGICDKSMMNTTNKYY